MRNFKAPVLYSLLLVFSSLLVFAQDPNITTPLPNSTPAPAPVSSASPAPAPLSSNDIIDKIIEREHFFMAQMRHLHPLVETYIQNLKPEDGRVVPTSDQYFLGRIDMSNGAEDHVFKSQSGFGRRFVSKLTSIYGMKFLPLGFAQMVVLDEDFQRKDYDFSFVRREFLGEVRCVVIDVQPKGKNGRVRFVGRIWVEDQDYNIVRFNGTYGPDQRNSNYLHFDSWRLNLRPGMWLPAYIYSEESDKVSRAGQKFHFKAQTRLWGYDLQALSHNSEFTEIAVDSPDAVHDQSDAAQDASPVESERRWQREAEDNAIERLQKIGLIAPEGDVDKVLLTVVNNLIVTNNLNIDPPIRARVLLTSPLESFTIGHTIIISRGLLDVLPDEASLAMVLAHEMGHVVLGHRLDTKFAFNDRMFFPDEDTFERLDFARNSGDEDAADKKAEELLANSPYKDKLATAGLFLKALQQEAPELKSLIRPHMGNGLASGNSLRMSALLASAPNVDSKQTNQIAALPLGGRVKLDPWSNRVELLKTKPVAVTSADEKMPFEVTPFFPFLTRFPNPGAEKVALTTPVN
jgi:Peptidase family M48